MIELERLEIEKETPNKLRWGTTIDRVPFEIYIPKWRVPEPWPAKVYVKLKPIKSYSNLPNHLSEVEVPSVTNRPVVAYVESYKEHKHTLRYRPIGDKETWEIGEPYIPYSLTHNCAPILEITVYWSKRN